MRVIVLNGWAASERAWSLCRFTRERIFSYIEELDGLPDRFIESSDEHVIIVGWSMGGSYALKLAVKYPDKISGLVLVAATPRMMEDKEAGWRGMSEHRLKAFEAAAKMLGGGGLFGPPEGKPNPYEPDSDENLARGLKYLEETDLRSSVERFAASHPALPVAVFQSERDGIVRPSNADFLSKTFANSCLSMIAGSEHALPIAIPEEIDRAVERILAAYV